MTRAWVWRNSCRFENHGQVKEPLRDSQRQIRVPHWLTRGRRCQLLRQGEEESVSGEWRMVGVWKLKKCLAHTFRRVQCYTQRAGPRKERPKAPRSCGNRTCRGRKDSRSNLLKHLLGTEGRWWCRWHHRHRECDKVPPTQWASIQEGLLSRQACSQQNPLRLCFHPITKSACLTCRLLSLFFFFISRLRRPSSFTVPFPYRRVKCETLLASGSRCVSGCARPQRKLGWAAHKLWSNAFDWHRRMQRSSSEWLVRVADVIAFPELSEPQRAGFSWNKCFLVFPHTYHSWLPNRRVLEKDKHPMNIVWSLHCILVNSQD